MLRKHVSHRPSLTNSAPYKRRSDASQLGVKNAITPHTNTRPQTAHSATRASDIWRAILSGGRGGKTSDDSRNRANVSSRSHEQHGRSPQLGCCLLQVATAPRVTSPTTPELHHCCLQPHNERSYLYVSHSRRRCHAFRSRRARDALMSVPFSFAPINLPKRRSTPAPVNRNREAHRRSRVTTCMPNGITITSEKNGTLAVVCSIIKAARNGHA